MTPFELEAPTDKAQILTRLAEADDAQIIAGGTGILNLMKQRLATPERLISLHKVVGLNDIEWHDSAVTIGARRTLLEIEADCQDRIPVISQTLTEVANPRIRPRPHQVPARVLYLRQFGHRGLLRQAQDERCFILPFSPIPFMVSLSNHDFGTTILHQEDG